MLVVELLPNNDNDPLFYDKLHNEERDNLHNEERDKLHNDF